ncbi:hypothetical protein V8E51_002819 [Hyaloscypha variabilis]
MQAHVTDISGTTVRYYFASAVSLAVSTVLIAWLLSSLWLQRVWSIWEATTIHVLKGEGRRRRK